MINIRTIRKLADNDGLTLKCGKIVNYKSGWQVATEGIETADISKVIPMIKKYNGSLYPLFLFLEKNYFCL